MVEKRDPYLVRFKEISGLICVRIIGSRLYFGKRWKLDS